MLTLASAAPSWRVSPALHSTPGRQKQQLGQSSFASGQLLGKEKPGVQE